MVFDFRRHLVSYITADKMLNLGPAYPSPLPASALQPRQPTAAERKSGGYRPEGIGGRQNDRMALLQRLTAEASPRMSASAREQTIANVERQNHIRDLERLQVRQWVPGNVYAPHDLSAVEMQKWRERAAGNKDVLDLLGIDPLQEWKNPSIMGEFVTPLGRIMHRKETGLRAVNQRKVAKAIRRAVGMGLMPSVHRHPEILEEMERKRNERRFGLDGRSGIVRQ